MSLKIPGKLVVQVRNGSRGAFAVGDLMTPVGNFKVKDQFLDQFAEGEYEGEFIVTQIYPNSYTYRGSITTEIRAKVVDYVLATAEEKPVNPEPEPDPIDQSAASSRVDGPTKVESPVGDGGRQEAQEKSESADSPAPADLFDDDMTKAIDSGNPIKLDPTIDRQKFREQRDFLKACGYRFNSTDQVWLKANDQQ